MILMIFKRLILRGWCSDGNVHGDIRHLENHAHIYVVAVCVHGDIRHLEKQNLMQMSYHLVHGDIRHLENVDF